MIVVDICSYGENNHPWPKSRTIQYLLAPPDGATSAQDLGIFRETLEKVPQIVGGLLPVNLLPQRSWQVESRQPFWKALVLSPYSGSSWSILLKAVHERLNQPELFRFPVVVECGIDGFSRPQHLTKFLDKIGVRPVVLTHGGQLRISGSHLAPVAKIFADYPHTYLETSGIYRQDFLEEMVQKLGCDRILYGSGFPWMDERLELERVRILPISVSQLQLICEGNARRLFALSRQ